MGKGAFQELDQLAAVAEHVKWAGQAARLEDIPGVIASAFQVRTGEVGLGGVGWCVEQGGRHALACRIALAHVQCWVA